LSVSPDSQLKVGDTTITGDETIIEVLKEVLEEDKKCKSPSWCDDGQACSNIDETTGEGVCVDVKEYDKTTLTKIILGEKKIFGSEKAIKELKKRLGLLYPESFLAEMRKYCDKYKINFDEFKERFSVFEHEIALKSLTLEKMLNFDDDYKKRIYDELYEKWIKNQSEPSSLGTPEPIDSDPGTPEGSPPTTPDLEFPKSPPKSPLKEKTPPKSPPKPPPKEKSPPKEKTPPKSPPKEKTPPKSPPKPPPKEKTPKEKALKEGTPVFETPLDVDDLLREVKIPDDTRVSDLTGIQAAVIKCLGLSS
jgi:hypothetical protein